MNKKKKEIIFKYISKFKIHNNTHKMRQNNPAQNSTPDKDSNSDSTNSSYDLGISPNNKIMDLQNSINFNKNKYIRYLESLINEEIDTIIFENENYPLLPFELEFHFTEGGNCIITVKNPDYKLFENNIDIYLDDELIIEDAKISSKKITQLYFIAKT